MHIAVLFLLIYVKGAITKVVTGQNVCPQTVIRRNSDGYYTRLILNCCPDYFLRDGKCQECSAGKFGLNCLYDCTTNFYGFGCRQMCSCLEGQTCDPVHGCICDKGFTGPLCLNACPYGKYGVQCSNECICAHGAECDPVSGVCLCLAGWIGNQCTKACSNGTYGVNCTAECMCTKDALCDHVTGECVCPAGRFGYNCTKVCEPGTHGVNCNEECFCAHDAMCDPINGNCLCPAGLFGVHCTKKCPSGKYGIKCSGICNCSDHDHCDAISGDCNLQTECHLGYYDYNLDYNCSQTCRCKNEALCNKISGICDCKDNTSCINIRKITFPNNTTEKSINRNLLVLMVTVAVSLLCVLLLALTYLPLRRYLKKRRNRSSQNNVTETDDVQGPYNEINHYSEILDHQLDDIRISRMLENGYPQYRFEQTTNGEYGYQNNAQLLSNIDMFEERLHNSYCSLQHINDDYLNPYCALRFERRVHSCRF